MAAIDTMIAEFWTYVADNIKNMRIDDLANDRPIIMANRGKDLSTYSLTLTQSGVISAKMFDLVNKMAKTYDMAIANTMIIDYVVRSRTLTQFPAEISGYMSNIMMQMKGKKTGQEDPAGSVLMLKEIVIDSTSLASKPLIDRIVAAGNKLMQSRYDDFAGWRIIKHSIVHSKNVELKFKLGGSVVPDDLFVSWIDSNSQSMLVTVATSLNITPAEVDIIRQQTGQALISSLGYYLIEKHKIGIQVLVNPPVAPKFVSTRCIAISSLIDTLAALVSAAYNSCTFCGIHEYNCDVNNSIGNQKTYKACNNCMTLLIKTKQQFGL